MYKIVKTTSDDKIILNKIANQILEDKLSPCVSISKKNKSYYKWNNEIQSSKEYSLNIKTSRDLVEKCYTIIKKLHNYETPEIIEINFKIINNKYKEWFEKNIK